MAKAKGIKPTPDLLSVSYHRIVVKLGTSLLTGGSDQLNEEVVSDLVRQVAQLHHEGLELVVVSREQLLLAEINWG